MQVATSVPDVHAQGRPDATQLALGFGWGVAVSVGKDILLGVGLWLLTQVVVLPSPGSGLFGTAITPAIAAATLVLHMIYGAAYGWLVDRR